MELKDVVATNVRQAVPFLNVTNIEASLRFYVDGLGFKVTHEWKPEGRIRWCWLELGAAAMMIQQYWKDGKPGGEPEGPLGQGVSICFMCDDAIAIYHDAIARGLEASRPFVGNNLWVTSLADPDGYRLDFESPTDTPEDTVYGDGMRATSITRDSKFTKKPITNGVKPEQEQRVRPEGFSDCPRHHPC